MRKPLALTNWKMEMTVSRSLAFVQNFRSAIGSMAEEVDIILCPPYTALYPMAQVLKDSPITLGGQNVSTAPGGAYTGEISAALLTDAGCRWVLLGHWEVRRHFGDTDETVNRKLHAAQRAGLSPILLVGEAKGEQDKFREALAAQLQRVLEGCDVQQIEEMVMVYEPEWTINVEEPASPEHVGAGCGFIREWLVGQHGASAAQAARIIYGGSVTPAHARDLLGAPDVDGLGAGRKGRQVKAFAEIVQLIATTKGP
jgi:triosephosphate isomerase